MVTKVDMLRAMARLEQNPDWRVFIAAIRAAHAETSAMNDIAIDITLLRQGQGHAQSMKEIIYNADNARDLIGKQNQNHAVKPNFKA